MSSSESSERPSLLSYYQHHRFNPVPIGIEDPAIWQTHRLRRLNLYQRHLKIPVGLLRDRSVIEFGCNSGENSLVLASLGANLTLVEPNKQVLPRLEALFRRFGLESRLVSLVEETLQQFESEVRYDLVLAEGFLHSLPDRDEMVLKIGKLLAPGGLGVISFIDRVGAFLELTRALLLWRSCKLMGIASIQDDACLELARRLYGEDFGKINASRSLETWWKDTLVNPLFRESSLWSYGEILNLIERAGGEFHASSPAWDSIDHFRWYKDAAGRRERHERIMEDRARMLPFFLTGAPTGALAEDFQPEECARSVAELVRRIAEYLTAPGDLNYPEILDRGLAQHPDRRVRAFNTEMKGLYRAVPTAKGDELIAAYHQASTIRSMWGTPYHYVCFTKEVGS